MNSHPPLQLVSKRSPVTSRAITLLWLLLSVFCAGVSEAEPVSEPDFRVPPGDTKGNFKNDVVYYIMVDRFFDAEDGNNVPLFAYPDELGLTEEERAIRKANRDVLPLMYDPTHSSMGQYFGGDLDGVRQKLPYLADLGVTQVILSPVMENANGFLIGGDYFLRRHAKQRLTTGSYHRLMTAYHGYWTRDWWSLEEHYRSPNDSPDDPMGAIRRLLNDAKKHQIGILLDITLNQTSPPQDTFIHGGWVFANGTLVSPFDLEKALKGETGFFHPYFSIDFSSPSKRELEHGTLAGGMPDLNQENPEVRRYLLDAALFWLNFNKENGAPISGFRVDAIKHVGADFWREFENVILAQNPSAILLGEYFSGGYFNQDSIEFMDSVDFFAMYDFDLSVAAKRFFANDRKWDGRAYVLRQLLLGRRTLERSSSSRWVQKVMNPGTILDVPESAAQKIDPATASEWVGFVDNHDLPRVRTEYGTMTDTQYMSALTFLFAIPRVPGLLYGCEIGLSIPSDPRHQGLFGTGGDPFDRQMMVFPGDPGWNQEIYDYTKKLIAFRKDNPVLRFGSIDFLYPNETSPHEDIFFVRRHAEENSKPKVLFAYRTAGGNTVIDASDIASRAITDFQTGEAIYADKEGKIRIPLKRSIARLFALKDDG